VFNLEEVPVTHRRRFNVIGPDTEKQLGAQGYDEMLNELRGKILPANHQYTQMVARVVELLLPSTHGLSASDEWRVHVIDDPQQKNAFVMPGGKVFVFTGLLPIAKDEAGLAAVLGHEIAHNVAHHMAERISGSIFIALAALITAYLFDVSGQLSNGIANLFLGLPNSRTQEMEADHIGLLMMAESCYDPEAAVDLWARMQQAEQFAPPQFLSTHPTSYNRRELIKKWLPEAKQKYEEGNCGVVSRYTSDFKDAFKSQPAQSQGKRQPQSVSVQRRGQDDDDDDFF
jgi:predicted Zn-dependent protease